MTEVHTLYPTKGVYFTECTANETSPSFADNLKWDVENLIVGAPLNWAQTITKWNIALDSHDGPQNGGCANCRGLVTIDDTVSPAVVSFNVDYYTLGHISKFVQPGAFRIGATTFGSASIEDVAFLNPDGSRVLIVLNGGSVAHTFKVRSGTQSFSYALGAGAAATFVWSPSSVVSAPFGGSARAIPGTIPAEGFDDGGEGVAYHDTTAGNTGSQFRNTDVDIETSAEGGYDVGWIDAGEWLNYTVNVESAGDYTVQLRVASPGGATMHVGFNGPSNGQRKSVSIPATAGWQSWTTVSVPVTLGAGIQQMTLYFDTGGMNVRFAVVASASSGSTGTGGGSLSPFSGTAVSLPGQILAANFDDGGESVAYHDTTPGNTGAAYRNTDVDVEASSEGGYDVGWIEPGEWLNYTVNVSAPGNYTVQLRVASPIGGTSLHVGFNGPSAGTWKAVSIPATGGWQNWTTVSVPVTLGAGVQQMTLYFDTAGLNLLWAEVGQ